MKGAIDEGKEISPMFPRLHVKDVEKGGPKAPLRNKMALYEQFGRNKGQKHLPSSL
jgi:protein EARLY FLOWERING 3